ncbi:MAG: glutamate--tRNA ligase, partial [Microbacteriaceae bacterium]|nr:glutamate--tRNA ligase [Microbacteriaceae bacterium]
ADQIEYDADAVKALADNAGEVLQVSIDALQALPESEWRTEPIQAALQAVLIERLGLKPRFAFAPLRVAASGRRVSPPLFESFELLGKEESLVRLRQLQGRLAQ